MTAEIKPFGKSAGDAGKQQFLDHIARTYDEYVEEHGTAPEGVVYCFVGIEGASSSWLTTGRLSDHTAAYVSWAANIMHGRVKIAGDGQ